MMFIANDSTEVVAICTGRVEAKLTACSCVMPCRCCNLHGACGGKVPFTLGIA